MVDPAEIAKEGGPPFIAGFFVAALIAAILIGVALALGLDTGYSGLWSDGRGR